MRLLWAAALVIPASTKANAKPRIGASAIGIDANNLLNFIDVEAMNCPSSICNIEASFVAKLHPM